MSAFFVLISGADGIFMVPLYHFLAAHGNTALALAVKEGNDGMTEMLLERSWVYSEIAGKGTLVPLSPVSPPSRGES